MITKTLPQIRGVHYDFYTTRSFIENVREIMGDKSNQLSIFIANLVDNSDEIKNAKMGKMFSIKILNTFNITCIKNSCNEVTLSSLSCNR